MCYSSYTIIHKFSCEHTVPYPYQGIFACRDEKCKTSSAHFCQKDCDCVSKEMGHIDVENLSKRKCPECPEPF